MFAKRNFEDLIKPSAITLKEGYNNLTKSVIIIEPLSKGFGDTIGNALRRVMLSSVGGFSVTSIKIDGVTNEFTSILGVREDVTEIVMNLKALSISKSKDRSPFSMRLTSSQKGPVYAGSMEYPSGVQIFNGDMPICNIEEGGKIDIQMHVEYGLGYGHAQDSEKLNKTIDHRIYVDSIFSPVRKVLCKVENARVGQITNYDRLVMEIETNGSISPREAVSDAATIMQNQLDVFIDKSSNEDYRISHSGSVESDFNKNLIRTIDELELSVRSYNCLKNENVVYVGDLVTKTESEMLKTANFGRKSLNELRDNLRSMGLSFGMRLENWPPKNLDELLKLKNKEF